MLLIRDYGYVCVVEYLGQTYRVFKPKNLNEVTAIQKEVRITSKYKNPYSRYYDVKLTSKIGKEIEVQFNKLLR